VKSSFRGTLLVDSYLAVDGTPNNVREWATAMTNVIESVEDADPMHQAVDRVLIVNARG